MMQFHEDERLNFKKKQIWQIVNNLDLEKEKKKMTEEVMAENRIY